MTWLRANGVKLWLVHMSTNQLKAAFKLIALMDGDCIAQSDADSDESWYQHKTDRISDIEPEENI